MTVMLLQNNVCVYSNNNNNNLSKSGPSTIEDQFRQEVDKNGAAEGEGRPRLNVFSLPHTGGPKREGKAMNYYRLWIYTCNAVLLVSVLGFVVVAGRVLLVDPRRSLIPGLTLYEPSLLYAYLALLTQSGLLQLLGCLGAHKLSEKLLNTYWFLLLFLLFGDAFIGVVWVFRFDKIYTDLKPGLKERLQIEYGVNEEFTSIWDSIQHDFRCCGVEGPQDFNEINLTRKNSTKRSNRARFSEKSPENDRNRVTVSKNSNPSSKDSGKSFTTRATTDEDDSSDAKSSSTDPYFSASATTSSGRSDLTTRDPSVRYVRNVPESCCRILTEDVPDERKIEKHEEPQSKPTAIRQRLEKKKNRHQEIKISKRSAAEGPRRFETFRRAISFEGEVSCAGSADCRAPSKRHALDNKFQFRSSHVRHDILYRNTHHYTTSVNAVDPDETRDKKSKELKYSTGNFKIMDTCANVNGHPVGTVYGMSETLHFSIGCEVKLKKWLRDSAHVLGVFGYCVIAFLKLCFLGILRYEIREMIQKIKMLQGELQPPVLLLSSDSPAENPEIHSPASVRNFCNHADGSAGPDKGPNAVPREPAKEAPDRLGANSLGNAFLLLQPHDSGQTTPVHQPKGGQAARQSHRLFGALLGSDPGNDSDTNSHSALLLDGDDPPPKKSPPRLASNGNNNYEAHELQDLLARRTAQI